MLMNCTVSWLRIGEAVQWGLHCQPGYNYLTNFHTCDLHPENIIKPRPKEVGIAQQGKYADIMANNTVQSEAYEEENILAQRNAFN